jgi:hypothetical protein
MDTQLLIDLTKILEKTPEAMLEYTEVSTNSEEPEQYDTAVAGYIATGYEIVKELDTSPPSCYMTNGRDRIYLRGWQTDIQDQQYWAFPTIHKVAFAASRMRSMTRAFVYIGGITDISEHIEASFLHIISGKYLTLLWRKDPIFPDLWK